MTSNKHEHTVSDQDVTITADSHVGASLTPPQWFAAIGVLVVALGTIYSKLWSVETAIADATKMAQVASADARTAMVQAAELKSDMSKALADISGQLGYIRGQLERITAGPSK